jgi:hypothetical protein
MAFPVFFDTCTLFGQVLTDLLLSLAEQGCFAPYWSTEVLDAMERNVVATGRADAEAVHRRRVLMEEAFPEAVVEGYAALVATMTNHPGDRHVLAACVVSPARTLVTFNVKDFPSESPSPYEVEVVHPDAFLLDQLDLHPQWSAAAIQQMLRQNRLPPQNVHELAAVLGRSGLPNAAAAILDLLS